MINDSKAYFGYDEYEESANYIQRHTPYRPDVGLILGSGLSPLAEQVEAAEHIPYSDIPHFPVSGVPGHAGKLVAGQLAGKSVLVMQGRTHFYEGYTMQHITLPVRVMQVMGIKTLIVTNAAGGINADFRAGDLMLIVDHINLIGMGGSTPLRGPNIDRLGPRFPSMTQPYDRGLMRLARQTANRLDVTLREGVYACLAGPSFETPAEIRFLNTIGADAVGMSTVPEVIVANHGGMRVLGISSITNVAVKQTDSGAVTTHKEVLETGQLIAPKMKMLIKGILAEVEK